MRTVSWKIITDSETLAETISLIEFMEGNKAIFWGSINTKPNENGKYEFCAFSKDRILHTVPKEQYADTIEEAKQAIEEYLKEQIDVITAEN